MTVPRSLEDVSQFRVVPDNQEAFASTDSLNQSLIVEILEYQKTVPDNQSAAFFFQEIAESNEVQPGGAVVKSESTHVCPQLPGIVVEIAVGTQLVYKFHEAEKEQDTRPDTVKIYLGCIRLPKHQSEIVVSLNVPLHHTLSATVETDVPQTGDHNEHILRAILDSVQINNWGLFMAGESGGTAKRA